jgi:catechol 2,3-dioxygenase-like lactoylglutathione lyase family enzyme
MMGFSIDHLVIAAPNLDAATTAYQMRGFQVVYGGRHASGSTHNALIYLADGSYLELLAPTGDAAAPDTTDYNALIEGRDGLIGYCLYAPAQPPGGLRAVVQRAQARGIPFREPSDGGRVRPDGQALRWQIAVLPPENHPTDALMPFVIADETPRTLRALNDAVSVTHPNGTTGIAALTLLARDLPAEIDRQRRILDAEPLQTTVSEAVFALGEARLRVITPVTGAHEARLGSLPRALDAVMLMTSDSPLTIP